MIFLILQAVFEFLILLVLLTSKHSVASRCEHKFPSLEVFRYHRLLSDKNEEILSVNR